MTVLRLVEPLRSSVERLTKDLGARTRVNTHDQSPRGVTEEGTRPHRIIVFIHGRATLVAARWGYGADVGVVREMPIEKIGTSLRCLIPISGFQALVAPVGKVGEKISLEATSGQGGVVAGIWHPDGPQGPQSFAIVTDAQDYAGLDQPAQLPMLLNRSQQSHFLHEKNLAQTFVYREGLVRWDRVQQEKLDANCEI